MLNQHARDLIDECRARVARGTYARERSEDATERIAQEVIAAHRIRGQTFHCPDERHDYIAEIASHTRLEYGLSDEQHDHLIELLRDAAPKAVEQ